MKSRVPKFAPNEIFKQRTRNPYRIRSSDLIRLIFQKNTFFESKDPALICGRGYLDRKEVLFLGQEKPKGDDIVYARKVNFGMLRPDGYRQAIELLGYAEEADLPVITFIDTPGADPSTDSAGKLQSWSISDCISKFCTAKTRTISLILGEGGSGGAIALQVTDKRLMLEHAMYYVIAPESCGSILFRDNTKILESILILKPASHDMLKFGIVDEVIREPAEIRDHEKYARVIKPRLTAALKDLSRIDMERLLEARRRRVLGFGVLRKSGFLSHVADIFSRSGKESTRLAKARVVETEHLTDALELAYLESKNIDLSKPHVLCEKDDARGCGRYVPLEEYLDNYKSCPFCGKGETLSPEEWIDLLCDANTFVEFNKKITAFDLLGEEEISKDYRELLERSEIRSGSGEALVTGAGKISGYETVLAISDFNFIGGSMGSAVGEKFTRAVRYCLEHDLPLLSICSSGGARMHEGTVSLVQMAKTNMAVAMLKEARLPFVSLLAHPCTGGSLASYATQGTINLGEENALIAFAGPRVSELAGIKVDPACTRSEFILERGGIDEIVPRRQIKRVISRYLKFYHNTKRPG